MLNNPNLETKSVKKPISDIAELQASNLGQKHTKTMV